MKSQQTNVFYVFYMTKPLTAHAQYGLMRPVARIAQSVEQGIENPCVLGSIPSPGTIFKETSLTAGFLLSGLGQKNPALSLS
jgi:hypothetical protein